MFKYIILFIFRVFLLRPDHLCSVSCAMASPPSFLYMTETLEVDKNLLSKLQMSKYSQTAGKQLRT